MLGADRWRRAFSLRSSVEGAGGTLENPSRQRMRRGQNRLPCLAMANLINALKAAVFSEEQLRSWQEETGLGPADHPLLQPDPHDWSFTDLTKEQAKAIELATCLRPGRRATRWRRTQPERQREQGRGGTSDA